MTANVDKQEGADPRVYFAAERTLLAWVRTGLALMGFGFVVARFGLFLREMAALPGAPHIGAGPQQQGMSLWFGTTLVILGVVVTLSAAARHWDTIRRLEQGQPLRFSPLSLVTLIAILLALLGVLMAVYLLFGLNDWS